MTNEQLSQEITELRVYLETKIPHLATKEDLLGAVAEAIEKHCNADHGKTALSTKQIGLIVSAGVALAGALTAFLTGLVG